MKRISDQVYLIRGALSCMYFCEDGTLIDAGAPFEGPRILKEVRMSGGGNIRKIILTHRHIEHVGSLDYLRKHTSARVFALRIHYRTSFLARATLLDVDNAIDDYVENGDELPILGGAQVIATPGHTPDHMGLYVPGKSILFSGDALQAKRGHLVPPPRIFNDNPELARESYFKLIELNARFICPGHRGPYIRPEA
jgi:glyoxylase-like metal-dependent hydrolase (beta-lactamase superfamily II)